MVGFVILRLAAVLVLPPADSPLSPFAAVAPTTIFCAVLLLLQLLVFVHTRLTDLGILLKEALLPRGGWWFGTAGAGAVTAATAVRRRVVAGC